MVMISIPRAWPSGIRNVNPTEGSYYASGYESIYSVAGSEGRGGQDDEDRFAFNLSDEYRFGWIAGASDGNKLVMRSVGTTF
jgi:hypothetical protein